MNVHEVARIVEPIEAQMRRQWWGLMPESFARKHRPLVAQLGGSLITLLQDSTSKSMNVVSNLGVTEEARESMIDEIVDLAKANRVKRFSFHLSPSAQSNRIEKWLLRRNFKLHSYYSKHFRQTKEPAKIVTDLVIKQINKKYATSFARVVCKNFGWPESRIPWVAATVGEPKFNHYMAFDGNLPVATGVLYIEGRCGYLAWGATMSTHRRRGGQAALIAERVRRAKRLGLKCVTAETFGPAPGRPAISYRNFIRNGFEEAYRRPIFIWEQAR